MSLESPFTVRSMVNETIDVLRSYVADQDQQTSLSGNMTASDLTLQVSAGELLSRGLLEIGEELVYVESVDTSAGTATVAPWGRGQSGSEVVSHDTGTRVTVAPMFPRRRVGSNVAAVLREIFPWVFPVDEDLLDINPARTNYPLPDDAYQVLSVEWRWPGPSQMWAPVERWRQNKPMGGLEIEIISATWPGAGRVRVKYAKQPKTEWSMDDSLTDFGYDHEIRDLVVLGAAAKTLAFLEPGRIQARTMEATGRAEASPTGAASDASRYLLVLFRQRLDEERQQILQRHPLQPHRTR